MKQTHTGLYNQFKRDHGPFDFWRCLECGSGTTQPVPTREELTALYSTFTDGMPDGLRQMMQDRSESPWHDRPVRRVRQLARLSTDAEFTWHDVGAGEMARLIATTFPRSRGICTDLHERPPTLGSAFPSITWISADLNDEQFAESGAPVADVVYATGVWEHVQHPVGSCTIFFGCSSRTACCISCARTSDRWPYKVMGRAWPYFSPGEHLHMPTPAGAARYLRRQILLVGRDARAEIRSTPMSIPYKVNYLFSYVARTLGCSGKVTVFPSWFGLPFPTGALETWARL